MTETILRPQPLTLFLLVRALPSWLALPRARRREIAAAAAPSGGETIRQFDCEAFTAMCSDIWMVTAASAEALNTGMERLRDTPLFTHPHFEFVAILPAIEDGWQAFEAGEAAHV
ncbi:darcynin family protein [Pseudoroseicyclus sp. CXY001]|uniref:darcynin family protein n=1 Tax=Pseudoroseicyclus sp. CXY001 TaxID=3242492 RepID=UPI003570C198